MACLRQKLATDLVVEVVHISGHKHVNIPHDFKDVQTLEYKTSHNGHTLSSGVCVIETRREKYI